jgi:hypothetical protein
MFLLSYLVILSTILFIYNKIILCIFSSRHENSQYYYSIKFTSIKQIVEYILNKYNIKSRQDLDIWCGGRNREKLYNEVKKYSLCCLSLDELKRNTRQSYESLLPGYTNYCIKYTIK